MNLPDVVTHPWHAVDHHDPDGGFRNVWQPYRGGSFWKGMAWFLSRAFTAKENRLPAVRTVDPSALHAEVRTPHFTWIGHSTLLVRTGSLNLLIDPIFSRRASPFSFAGPEREPALPLQLEDLPGIDVVLLSHDHYDHLDARTLEALIGAHDPLFLVPLGVAAYLRGWGSDRVVEMDWWQYADVDGIRCHSLPAKHFSGRSMVDRDATLWVSWYLEDVSGGIDVFYAGDTGYAEHFRLIRERIGSPDVAVLPIGAYLPSWLMQPVHVDPEEALHAFRDLEADHFIPVHWGTFDLADEPLHAPADTLRRLVREHALENAVHLLDVGQTWALPGD